MLHFLKNLGAAVAAGVLVGKRKTSSHDTYLQALKAIR